jgi:hypothetical protein
VASGAEDFISEVYWAGRARVFHELAYEIAFGSAKCQYGSISYDMLYKYFQYMWPLKNLIYSIGESYNVAPARLLLEESSQ